MDNIIKVNFTGRSFPELDKMRSDVRSAIFAYADKVPLMGAIGVLRLIEHELIQEAGGV